MKAGALWTSPRGCSIDFDELLLAGHPYARLQQHTLHRMRTTMIRMLTGGGPLCLAPFQSSSTAAWTRPVTDARRTLVTPHCRRPCSEARGMFVTRYCRWHPSVPLAVWKNCWVRRCKQSPNAKMASAIYRNSLFGNPGAANAPSQ